MIFNNLKNLFESLINFYKAFINYLGSLKEKLNNLEDINLNLAKNLLNENKLTEAYYRFKIINFLWPNNIEGIFFYSLLLIFSNKTKQAIKTLEKAKNNEDIKKLLYIAKNKDADYILDLVEKNNIKILDIKNVL